MTYHVLARKWRPQTFADLVGQSHVVKSLTFALSKNQVHHAYLLTGTRGVGKTSIARIFAKSLNCETNGVGAEPCGICESCREIKSGKFVDLIEVDAASRTGVDETRELIESVSYRPTKGRYKVYLIDEVHMFSKSSFNALLKTLEEPPAYVKFILATTDPEKLPITVLSRCLQFNLKSLTQAQIHQHLVNICQSESINYDSEALALLANAGNGSMRDTLSMTDQAIAYGQGNLSLAAVTEILGTIQPADIEAILFAIATNNPIQLSTALHRLDDYEIDARAFLIELMHRLQQMAWAKEGIVESLSPTLCSTVNDLPKPLIHLWYDIAEKALPNLALSGEPKKAVEMTLLRMIAFIPDDWVTRHRTAFEDPIKKPHSLSPEKPEPSTPNSSNASNSIENIQAAAQTQAANSYSESPPWEDTAAQSAPDEKENEYQTKQFAEQAQATPIIEKDSLEAAEAVFSQEKKSPIDTTQPAEQHPAKKQTEHTIADTAASKAKTVASSDDLATKDQAAWHLDSKPSQETPPSMADIERLMQRGSDISAPPKKLEKTNKAENLSEKTAKSEKLAAPPDRLAANQPNNNEEATEVFSQKNKPAPPKKAVTETAHVSEIATTEKSVKKTTKKIDITEFNWFETVHQLSLSDYTLHFVSLGLLRLVEDEQQLQAILDLSPKHEVLSTQESLAEMQTALQKYFNTPIHFSVNLTDVYQQTPAEKKQQKQQLDRDSIVQQFSDNPITQRIVNELGGHIIDRTIRVIKTSQ